MGTRMADTVTVVTGGGSGLGRAAAEALAREGSAVGLLDLNGAAAEEAAVAIRDAGGRAVDVACDVTQPDSVAAAFDAVEQEFGLPTRLFNNAGVAARCDYISELAIEDFDACLNVNLRGVFIVAREFVRRVRPHAVPAAMVNTSSIVGVFAEPLNTIYAASKGGVIGLTRALAFDHAKEGIRANAICPGHIMTPMNDPFYAMPGAREQADAAHAMGRIGQPREIADLVVFLLSDEASFITGIPVVVDGGMSLGVAVVPDYTIANAVTN